MGVDGTQVTMQAVDLANVKTIVIHQIRPARTLYFSQAAAERFGTNSDSHDRISVMAEANFR